MSTSSGTSHNLGQGVSPEEQFRLDVLAGLRLPRKQIPSKYLYDRRGSELFETICRLEEYYLTRTETGIMQRSSAEIAAQLGPHCLIIELGCGSGNKVHHLLDRLEQPSGYVAIEISPSALRRASRNLAILYPELPVWPLVADYTRAFTLPAHLEGRRVIYFPGSTIGNFEPPQAREFLAQLRALCGPSGSLLIGVDLKKDPRSLHRAYNDAQGTTASFNLNLLERMNRELGADFRLDHFAHYAFYNARPGRIEMHLISLDDQQVHVAGEVFEFRKGEMLFTEASYKYWPEEFAALVAEAGFMLQGQWTDSRAFFAVQLHAAR